MGRRLLAMADIGVLWHRGDQGAAHHRWRRILLLVAIGVGTVAVGSAGFVAVSYAFRTRPGPRSIGSALNQFHHDTATTAASRVAPTTAPPTTQRGRPAVGVYQLAGQGSEHISFPPNSQSDGAVMPASVVDEGNGCWRWRVDYNVAHWEEYDFCTVGGVVRESANRNGQSWDFGTTKISNEANFTCPAGVLILPANPQPGDSSTESCTGTNTAVAGQSLSTGPVRIVGTDQLSIGGRTLAAVHERQQVTLSGSQTGSVVEDWWFEPSDGLPLRVVRNITIHTKSPIGTITYTESGSWQMRSLTPQT